MNILYLAAGGSEKKGGEPWHIIRDSNSQEELMIYQGRDIGGSSWVPQHFPCSLSSQPKSVWKQNGFWTLGMFWCRPKRRSERHCLCLQGFSVEPEYWAGTTLGVAYRAPLCLCSWVGKISAPVLKMPVKILARKQAVNYSPGNNRYAQVQSKHLGKSVHAFVTCSSLLLASSYACCTSSWAVCGDWSTTRYFMRLMHQIWPMASSESPARGL